MPELESYKSKTYMNMGYRESTISSLDEFFITCQESKLPLFRGQAEDLELLPSLGRLYKDCNFYGWGYSPMDLEKDIMLEFKRRSTFYLEKEPINWLEWMVTAQHHGLPTRLLDWTKSPIKALFFAVEDINNKSDGVVYGMEPTIGMMEKNPDIVKSDDNYLTPFEPFHINRRITAQDGCFTLFPFVHWEQMEEFKDDHIEGEDDYPENFRPISTKTPYKEVHILHKIIINGSSKQEILKALYTMGISHKSMFPDLDGLCKSLKVETLLGEL